MKPKPFLHAVGLLRGMQGLGGNEGAPGREHNEVEQS